MKTNSAILAEFSRTTGIRDGVVEALVRDRDASPRFIGCDLGTGASYSVTTTTVASTGKPAKVDMDFIEEFKRKSIGEFPPTPPPKPVRNWWKPSVSHRSYPWSFASHDTRPEPDPSIPDYKTIDEWLEEG